MFAFVTYGLEPGPVSRAVNGTEVRLVNDHHAPVAMGEIGELVQPQRYHRLRTGPGLLEDATKDGWFYTGDLMRQDEKGNLWFVSRKKHLIIRGGSNISPIEVEQVLTSHHAVQDAAVIGVPDPELGEPGGRLHPVTMHRSTKRQSKGYSLLPCRAIS